MNRFFSLAAFVCLAGLPAANPALAAKVKAWNRHQQDQYDSAKFRRAVISNTGAVRLSRQLKPLASLEAAHVWALAEDRAGNIYAATGDRGKIYKITPGGKATVVYTSDQGQILSLAVAPGGEVVYAGTGPQAKIIRLDARGARVLCELSASYVWALATDAKGETVYAGTGPKGKIYQVSAAGKAGVFYDTKQEHVLCLAVGGGNIYAGTDRTGRVYRIANGKGFVLFQAPQAEVRTMTLVGTTLYVGTSGTKKRTSAKSGNGDAKTAATRGKPSPLMAAVIKDGKKTATGTKAKSASKPEAKAKAASAPSAPGTGDNSLW